MTPSQLRDQAGLAEMYARNDTDHGPLWAWVAILARECADLAERIETQENRRVGRPPKDRSRFDTAEVNGAQ